MQGGATRRQSMCQGASQAWPAAVTTAAGFSNCWRLVRYANLFAAAIHVDDVIAAFLTHGLDKKALASPAAAPLDVCDLTSFFCRQAHAPLPKTARHFASKLRPNGTRNRHLCRVMQLSVSFCICWIFS